MRRSFSLRVFGLALVSCAVLSSVLGFSAAQALATGGEPTIVAESAMNVTEHDATLEVTIDPEGLETAYAFWLGREVCASSVGSENSAMSR